MLLLGYLKNGAFASLGLGRGSGAYYGSVEDVMLVSILFQVKWVKDIGVTHLIASSNTLFKFR